MLCCCVLYRMHSILRSGLRMTTKIRQICSAPSALENSRHAPRRPSRMGVGPSSFPTPSMPTVPHPEPPTTPCHFSHRVYRTICDRTVLVQYRDRRTQLTHNDVPLAAPTQRSTPSACHLCSLCLLRHGYIVPTAIILATPLQTGTMTKAHREASAWRTLREKLQRKQR